MSVCSIDSEALGVVFLLETSLDEDTCAMVLTCHSTKPIDDQLEFLMRSAGRELYSISKVARKVAHKAAWSSNTFCITLEPGTDADAHSELLAAYLEILETRVASNKRTMSNGIGLAVPGELKARG